MARRVSLKYLRLPSWPIVQQLRLEEALLRNDKANWCLFNRGSTPAIVMGFSGKPDELVYRDAVRTDAIPLVRRFSGGGTVYVDQNTLFSTLIINKQAVPDLPPFPRQIMRWTEQLYSKVFADCSISDSPSSSAALHSSAPTISSSCSSFSSTPSPLSPSPPSSFSSSLSNPSPMSTNHLSGRASANHHHAFRLTETDYCLGHLKCGGNAQSITKDRFVHHTSFLWDYDISRISAYLKIPARAPAYRAGRAHSDFLCRLRPFFPDPDMFEEQLWRALASMFDLQIASVEEALSAMRAPHRQCTELVLL